MGFDEGFMIVTNEMRRTLARMGAENGPTGRPGSGNSEARPSGGAGR